MFVKFGSIQRPKCGHDERARYRKVRKNALTLRSERTSNSHIWRELCGTCVSSTALTTSLGAQDDRHCAGIHITLAFNAAPKVEGEPTAEEKRALAGLKHYVDLDSGYSKQQSTRPQTLGYGLTDSPSGQAAWILEKFWAWTDCNGHPENIFSRDELLDNVMLYWVTATAASSARLYWESFGQRRAAHTVTVPTGVAAFPKEIITPVRRWMEPNFKNIQHWSEMPRGGHFAAFEQPELFVRDVRAFFSRVR